MRPQKIGEDGGQPGRETRSTMLQTAGGGGLGQWATGGAQCNAGQLAVVSSFLGDRLTSHRNPIRNYVSLVTAARNGKGNARRGIGDGTVTRGQEMATRWTGGRLNGVQGFLKFSTIPGPLELIINFCPAHLTALGRTWERRPVSVGRAERCSKQRQESVTGNLLSDADI